MAYTINFTAQITTELDERLRVERDKKIYRRLLCLDLLRQGYFTSADCFDFESIVLQCDPMGEMLH